MANRKVLRFATLGNVDDGKSTLIGRLLWDSKKLLDDQIEAVIETSRSRGLEDISLAFITDGLRAEREQGITIDVAYRYFSTASRKFIIADCPGHTQYTRNMMTGLSRAEVALFLVDATREIQTQTRRHLFLCGLLGVPKVLICVNKMDLVGFSESHFSELRAAFLDLAASSGISSVDFIPVAALQGHNIVESSEKMNWYQGPTIMEYLESVEVPMDVNEKLRLPVQVVQRFGEGRGLLGTVRSGVVREGDRVFVQPAGRGSVVKEIWRLDRRVGLAGAGAPVTIVLSDELDIERGDCLVHEASPVLSQEPVGTLCWMADSIMNESGNYLLMHRERQIRCRLGPVQWRWESHEGPIQTNDVFTCTLRLASPLLSDGGRRSDGFILIDEAGGATVAAGVLKP